MVRETETQLQSCIDDCTRCYAMCTKTIQCCLEKSGKHAEANHVRLLQDCAEVCVTSTNFMLRRLRIPGQGGRDFGINPVSIPK
jgi:hypothetical protein